jgi:hypothetical protein
MNKPWPSSKSEKASDGSLYALHLGKQGLLGMEEVWTTSGHGAPTNGQTHFFHHVSGKMIDADARCDFSFTACRFYLPPRDGLRWVM